MTVDRRNLLKGCILGASAAVFANGPASARTQNGTSFVLIHGSWHGAWCWANVTPHLMGAGYGVVAIDLPGHGLGATFPPSYFERPLNMDDFSTEESVFADIPLSAFTASIVDGVRTAKAGGAKRVILVSHSMGGVPMTFAAEEVADEIDGLIYISACMMPPGKPWGDYFEVPTQADEKVGPLLIGDASQIGCARLDPLSADPTYREAFKAALAADVDDDVLQAALNMMIPDAPFQMYFEVPLLTTTGFGALKRSFVKCTEDYAIRLATQDLAIADLDAAFPDNPTRTVEVASSHEVMLSKPKELAEAMIGLA